MYDPPEHANGQLFLHHSPSEPSLLEAWSDGKRDEEHQWISFNLNDVRNVRYGGSYLSFRRSMIRGRPPSITLQFASAEGAAQAARLIKGRISEDHTREEMKQILDVAWEHAVASSLHVRRESVDLPQVQDASGTSARPEGNGQQIQSIESQTVTRSGRKTARLYHSLPARQVGKDTRRTRRMSTTRKETSPEAERWSEKNIGWEQDWKQTLVYPATGRNRASVDKEDIPRLDEGEFLNDNLISFYLRYLQIDLARERPELFNQVHIFNTFFFEKLTSRKGGINYDGVKSWTSKLDLFTYDYIVVPVNENAHWYMAVICNAPKLIKQAGDDTLSYHISTDTDLLRPKSHIMTTVEREMSDISLEDASITRRSSRQLSSNSASSPAHVALSTGSPVGNSKGLRAPSRRLDASQPRIVTLDSLGSNHSATCKALKDYLVEEAKHKRNIELATLPGGMNASGIPKQENYCDCGIFVLGYIEALLKNPQDFVRKILTREDLNLSIDAAELRNNIRHLLFKLQKEQLGHLAQQCDMKPSHRQISGPSNDTSQIVKGKSSKGPESGKRDQPSTPTQLKRLVTSPSPARYIEGVISPDAVTRRRFQSASGIAADDGIVDIVKMPHNTQPATNAESSLKSANLHDSQPTSFSPDTAQISDIQSSVQLLSVVTPP
ncbi:Ulp1 protease family protein [Cordyceps javanica]|uniref:Ulp1 protease family protein n=1 Tax=Cordyceps javanica TaxID=43265 RepID=A0A545UVT8_9HYPO|nr:Ulp1 protease family protein [Cordyceps javanica]